MRKNTRRVYAAWRAHKADTTDYSIHTNGDAIYSYGTALVVQLDDDKVALNATKYSATTSRQQSDLRALLRADYGDVLELSNEPLGVAGYQLAERAGAFSV